MITFQNTFKICNFYQNFHFQGKDKRKFSSSFFKMTKIPSFQSEINSAIFKKIKTLFWNKQIINFYYLKTQKNVRDIYVIFPLKNSSLFLLWDSPKTFKILGYTEPFLNPAVDCIWRICLFRPPTQPKQTETGMCTFHLISMKIIKRHIFKMHMTHACSCKIPKRFLQTKSEMQSD